MKMTPEEHSRNLESLAAGDPSRCQATIEVMEYLLFNAPGAPLTKDAYGTRYFFRAMATLMMDAHRYADLGFITVPVPDVLLAWRKYMEVAVEFGLGREIPVKNLSTSLERKEDEYRNREEG